MPDSLSVQDWLSKLKQNEVYTKFINEYNLFPQLIALGLAIILAFVLRRVLTIFIDRILPRVEQMWIKTTLRLGINLSRPIFAYALLAIFEVLFQQIGWNVGIIQWAYNLTLVWFYYKLITSILELNMAERHYKFWYRNLFFPTFVVLVFLAALNMIDEFLALGFTLPNMQVTITIGSMLLGIAFLFLFYVIGRAIRRLLSETVLPESGAEPAVSQGVATLVFYVIVFIGVTISLTSMGINLTSLAVVAGGLSVGLGFGLQAIVNNFVSGFILLFEKSVGPGDVIRIGDVVGTVDSIGIRSIRITTRDNIELIIPNSYYLSEIVTNLTRTTDAVRLKVSVGVSYSSDPEKVKQALLEVSDHAHLLKEPKPEVWFVDFADSSLNFDLMVWTDQPEAIPKISSDLRFAIFDALKKHNIEIPFPQRDIHIRTDATKTKVGNNATT